MNDSEKRTEVLQRELNCAVLATSALVSSMYDIPTLWRVTQSYVRDLLLLAQEEHKVMSIIQHEILAQVRDSTVVFCHF